MSKHASYLLLLALGLVSFPHYSQAQPRPYIGYAYPAGGQQGTTFVVKLGGQALEDVNAVLITGEGVTAKVREYNRVLGAQEITLLNEQVRELKRVKTQAVANVASLLNCTAPSQSLSASNGVSNSLSQPGAITNLIARIEKRAAETVNRPASVALAQIVYLEVSIAPDAKPGLRELRLATTKGISNPLVFHVGQLPEFSRKPMITAMLQVLGKEEFSLRKRPAEEVEDHITLPCTVNGQIASGEVNRYRFNATEGQRLVFTTAARQLIPYIADAVPGWFQPVLVLYGPGGKEVAYDDDYRFKPDPTISYQVSEDGEYVLAIYDSIYRGREDFVYRITMGEIPFVTSAFPLGTSVSNPVKVAIKGWNLTTAEIDPPGQDGNPGVYYLTAEAGRLISNPIPFAIDTLPECIEKEPNNTLARAELFKLPITINGRINRPGDVDVFRFTGKSNESIVAEVDARRLDSPLDSVLKLTDAKGKLIAFNDDREDPASGVNTHHADSYLTATLPADGTYYLHLTDTAQHGGDEYGYRLRLGPPQPDFALRAVPSSISLRGKGTAQVSVYVIRKDGFAGPIKVALQPGTNGFSATPVSLSGTQTVARLNIKTDLTNKPPVALTVIGTAAIDGKNVTHPAVPAEDRMQAFLWRHLVPAMELAALVYDPNYQPVPKRIPPPRPPVVEEHPKTELVSSDTNAIKKPMFTKQQVAFRLRQVKMLYEEGLLTDEFYNDKVTECEAAR